MASLFLKLRGTVEALFQIAGGVQLKNNAGVLEARNAADSALAIVRGAVPAAATDLVPLAYAGAVYTGSPAVLQPVKTWIATVTTSAAGAVTVTLPTGFFTTILKIGMTLIDATTVPRVPKVLTFSATSIGVQVYQSNAVPLGGGQGLVAATVACTLQIAVQGI